MFLILYCFRYCFYNETQNILGNTYGMAVLQVRPTAAAAAVDDHTTQHQSFGVRSSA
jgi:tRNA(Met) C34 N-acetyltransferase TmcA